MIQHSKQKYTGLKLSFSEDKETASATTGKRIQPHRVDLIQKLMDAGELDNLNELFFNFNVPGYQTASTREHIVRESALLDAYWLIMDGKKTYDSIKK